MDTIGTGKSVLNREVLSFQGFICTEKAFLGHFKLSLIERWPLTGVPLYSPRGHQRSDWRCPDIHISFLHHFLHLYQISCFYH